MAHIPRTGVVGGNSSHCNPATSMPYNYSGNSGHRPHQQVHQYEPVPGSVNQPDPYSQQCRQNSNPFKLEKGSMILYGDPPCAGIVKWIGYLPEAANVLIAGIELVSMYKYMI